MRLGIYIMPDNAGIGMLENLCLETISKQPVNGCIDQYIECLKKQQSDKDKPRFNEPKVRIQSYLASCSPMVNSLGLGALKGYWDFNHSCFEELKDFIKQLFYNR